MSFKKDAAKHQKNFFHANERQETESDKSLRTRAQDHWLNESAASAGKNFYENYEVFKEVNDWRKGKKNIPEWFLDTLRSQHIPFNFFIPLLKEEKLAIRVLNELFGLNIIEFKIEIEYPPKKDNPLKDNTSFDTFIDYESPEGKGFIGIETKYTEGGYSPTTKESELFEHDDISIYYKNTTPDLFIDEKNQALKENSYRQIWRNHLLSIRYAKQKGYQKYISATFYPYGNSHFVKYIYKYNNFLTTQGKHTLKGITFEKFFKTLLKHAATDKQRNWICYLIARYLVIKECK